LTQIGAMIGTPRYMSPEQCDGADLSPAADVYSLGVILYEMLTGIVPFSGSSPLAIAVKHTSEIPRNPREFVPTIPAALDEVVMHTLEKLPQNRPANAAEFRAELLATAERLGLEHASIASAPNLEALRSVGTESPSGRLVIDISRLRENRASNSDSSEMTVLSSSHLARSPGRNGPAPGAAKSWENRTFPRLSVSLTGSDKSKKQLKIIAAIVALLLIGITVAVWSRSGRMPLVNVGAVASPSPSPTVRPSPSPSASATPSPKREARPTASPTPKKNSKARSLVNKVKRIFKNPF
jgi:serine/threonine protein kinase